MNDLQWSNAISLGRERGVLDTNGRTVTAGGTISGQGLLAVTGGGTLNIRRENTYAGGTVITGSGALRRASGTRVVLGEGGERGLGAGLVTLQGGSLLELAFSDKTFFNRLAGTAAETVLVSGRGVTLDADNSAFAGTWEITAGALGRRTLRTRLLRTMFSTISARQFHFPERRGADPLRNECGRRGPAVCQQAVRQRHSSCRAGHAGQPVLL